LKEKIYTEDYIGKIYFASDCHLGVPDHRSSMKREKIFVNWLESIKNDAIELYLLGDIFDFWFEYKKVVPKGYVRLLGKLAELSDSGIKIHYFTGNHDMWINNYFSNELNVKIYRHPVIKVINNIRLYIGHGDGLGPGDHGYKFIKKVFSNPLCKWLFARLHPNFGIGLANFFSRKSRIVNEQNDEKFLGEEKETLIQFCKEKLKSGHFDYFIFGHRHLPLNIDLSEDSKYINLGEWVKYFSFAIFDGVNIELNYYNNPKKQQPLDKDINSKKA